MSQEPMTAGQVFVEVLPAAREGRQIRGDEPSVLERIENRADDISHAIQLGSKIVADSLRQLASPDGWRVSEVSASFGIELTAEAGVVIAKTSVGATLEVTVTFVR